MDKKCYNPLIGEAKLGIKNKNTIFFQEKFHAPNTSQNVLNITEIPMSFTKRIISHTEVPKTTTKKIIKIFSK